jgi:probable F420-dependent oxidoreductase
MSALPQTTAAIGTAGPVALGSLGVWSPQLRFGDVNESRTTAGELEELGYEALWIPGSANPGVLDAAERLLSSTRRIAVATGVLNISLEGPEAVAAKVARLRESFPDRFLLGLGAGAPQLTDGGRPSPVRQMSAYLDALERLDPPVPPQARVLGALGPRMLELARERSAGAHTYLATPEHTRIAREILGPERLLAVEQTVVYEADPPSARGHARRFLTTHLGSSSHLTQNLRRVEGFGEADFEGGGSDELIDTLVAWGDESKIRERVVAHFEAGADHVCVQIVQTPLESWADTLDRLFLTLRA